MFKVVTIAGSDPSGGAGIQADLKTFLAHHVYGMSIITALTAQNTCGVRDVMDVPTTFLSEQFDCVFEDIFPDAVKIGMVSQPDAIHTIVKKLKQYQPQHVVLDPVMVSTSGHRLLSEDAVAVLLHELLPLSEIITPNIPEAEVLAACSITNKEDMIKAAEILAQDYQGAILIKGGHAMDFADDLLYVDHQVIWIEGKRINNPNTHGTGCTLSSAIASNLAKGESIITSVKNAKAYINGALLAQLDLGKGSGPLDHGWKDTLI